MKLVFLYDILFNSQEDPISLSVKHLEYIRQLKKMPLMICSVCKHIPIPQRKNAEGQVFCKYCRSFRLTSVCNSDENLLSLAESLDDCDLMIHVPCDELVHTDIAETSALP